MVLWWERVGFSLQLAASHGGLPFAGLLENLRNTDLQRAVLTAITALALALGAVLLRDARLRSAGFLMVGTTALISFATASEYWSTFANVGRLFTPLAAAPALYPVDGEAGETGRRVRVWLGVAMISLTVAILWREAMRTPLPFVVMS
jgi:hypothetical protein